MRRAYLSDAERRAEKMEAKNQHLCSNIWHHRTSPFIIKYAEDDGLDIFENFNLKIKETTLE
jgi:hypothetical protein